MKRTLQTRTWVKFYTVLDLIATVAALYYLLILRDLTNGLLFWIVSELWSIKRMQYEMMA